MECMHGIQVVTSGNTSFNSNSQFSFVNHKTTEVLRQYSYILYYAYD